MPYVFGDFRLDPLRYELARAGTLIPLRPKVFQVLVYLLVHHDRVVLKEELLAHLWPGQAVGDGALSSYILAVRQALGDSGQRQRLIRTVHGRGYRFVAPVRELDSLGGVEPPPVEVPPAAAASSGDPLCPCVPTAADPAGASLPHATEQYKLVTVMCGALADATALVGFLGPEALYHLTQLLGVLVREVMHHYAGTLMALTSEGFTALFGAPVAQEDHAQRALTQARAGQGQVVALVGGAAVDLYRQALALAEELGMRPLQAHGHRGLGTLYAKTGQQELARRELSTAIDLYRAMDMTFWLPQAEATLAQVEGR